jgi:hypothetical protein
MKITIIGIDDPEGGYIAIKGKRKDGNYAYYSGYNGGDSRESAVIIHSPTELKPFDDFYGHSTKYPVIADISQALETAGYDGLCGCGAGRLEPLNA